MKIQICWDDRNPEMEKQFAQIKCNCGISFPLFLSKDRTKDSVICHNCELVIYVINPWTIELRRR